jgi:hypothetical protein
MREDEVARQRQRADAEVKAMLASMPPAERDRVRQHFKLPKEFEE